MVDLDIYNNNIEKKNIVTDSFGSFLKWDHFFSYPYLEFDNFMNEVKVDFFKPSIFGAFWKQDYIAFDGGSFSFLVLYQAGLGILSKYISCILYQEGIPMIWCYDNKDLQLCMYISKYSIFTQFRMLNDLWGREFMLFKKNYEVSYNLISIKYNYRVVIKQIFENKVIGTTVSNLFASAGWLEREVWDMLGIIFYGHNDLRRILTDYGFLGHPLKKDFPLTGFVELRYDDMLGRIVFEPLELSQEMRSFDFSNPWTSYLTYDLNSKFFSDFINFSSLEDFYNTGYLSKNSVGDKILSSDSNGWAIDANSSSMLIMGFYPVFYYFNFSSTDVDNGVVNYYLNL